MYRYEDVLKSSLDYFNGDELAATTWIKKYCLRDLEGNLLEKSPEDMHNRIADEILRIEEKYTVKHFTKDKLIELLEHFRYLVPGGSQMSGIGDKFKHTSLSNCFVIGNNADSYGGIMMLDEELIQIAKRRGGDGIDLSHLRPSGAVVTNDARSSSGAASFMSRFSNSSQEVAQNGRRGALMLTIDITHPDSEAFIDAKLEQGKISGANISVRISKEFMKAVKDNQVFIQRFPCDTDKLSLYDVGTSPSDPFYTCKGEKIEHNELYDCGEGRYLRVVSARRLWEKITHNAWKMAEPGVLFWDHILEESPADVYEDFRTISTNPCLHPDTKILMADGTTKAIKDIVVGDEVKSFSYKDGRLHNGKVIWSGKTKENAELVQFEDLKCTPDHKIFEPRGERWIEAKDAEFVIDSNGNGRPAKFIQIDEKSDVYDITVEGYHNFFANDILVHNCGEIPLCPYDSCRLLSINLYSLVENPFTEKASIQYDKLRDVAKAAQTFMDDVMDLEIEHIEDIINKIKSDPESEFVKHTELNLWYKVLYKTKKGRRTGIGVTGIGDMLAALNLKYGSERANEVMSEVMRTIATSCYQQSITLVKERGAFEAFDLEKEKKILFSKTIPEHGQFLVRMFNQLEEQYQRDWLTTGRRNIACLTCAPSGTISIMTQTTSGIEPLFMVSYTRRRKVDDKSKATYFDVEGVGFEEFRVVHPKFIDWLSVALREDDKVKELFQSFKPREVDKDILYGRKPVNGPKQIVEKLTNEEFEQLVKLSPWYQATAQTIDPATKVKLQGEVQKWIDHSISCTVNLPKETTEETVRELYELAYQVGCKGLTVYRDGCRDGVLVSNKKEEKKNTDFSSSKRPEELPAQVYRFRNQKENWIAFIGFREGRPYEIFTGKIDGEVKWLPKPVKKGIIRQITDENGKHRYDFLYEVEFGYTNCFPAISQQFEREYWNYARFVSGMLRAAIPLSQIVSVLRGLSAEPLISVWKEGVARALSQFIEDGTKTGSKCPNCGADLIFEGGCAHCPNGDFDRCG